MEFPKLNFPDENSFSITQTQQEGKDLLLVQTELQLQSDIEAVLTDMNVSPVSVDMSVHTDENERIELDKVSIKLAAQDYALDAQVTETLTSLLGITPQIQYEDG